MLFRFSSSIIIHQYQCKRNIENRIMNNNKKQNKTKQNVPTKKKQRKATNATQNKTKQAKKRKITKPIKKPCVCIAVV